MFRTPIIIHPISIKFLVALYWTTWNGTVPGDRYEAGRRIDLGEPGTDALVGHLIDSGYLEPSRENNEVSITKLGLSAIGRYDLKLDVGGSFASGNLPN